MPTYQYRCTDCGRDLEVVQKFSDASLTECPTCSGALRKVFNAVGVVFKGSGFYRNDSRNGSNGDVKVETGSDPGKDGTKSEKSEKSEKSTEVKAAKGESGKRESGKRESGKPDRSGRKSEKVAASSNGSSSTGSKAAAS